MSKCKIYYTFDKIIIMKTLLLPNGYKKIGWFFLLPSFVAGIITQLFEIKLPVEPSISVFGYFGNAFTNASNSFRLDSIELLPNLISVLFLCGGLLVMFSKEKKEDEFINQIRLHALQFSVFVNYALLLLCILFIHGFAFLDVMVYNLFTIIIIYIVRFQYLIYKNSIQTND